MLGNIEDRRIRGQQNMGWLDGITDSMDMHLSKLWELLIGKPGMLQSMESVMPSNHLILCLPLPSPLQSFPASGSFPMSKLFTSGAPSIRALASVSVLPTNIQGWFPLGLTGLVSLQSKRLSRVFSSTTV